MRNPFISVDAQIKSLVFDMILSKKETYFSSVVELFGILSYVLSLIFYFDITPAMILFGNKTTLIITTSKNYIKVWLNSARGSASMLLNGILSSYNRFNFLWLPFLFNSSNWYYIIRSTSSWMVSRISNIVQIFDSFWSAVCIV